MPHTLLFLAAMRVRLSAAQTVVCALCSSGVSDSGAERYKQPYPTEKEKRLLCGSAGYNHRGLKKRGGGGVGGGTLWSKCEH